MKLSARLRLRKSYDVNGTSEMVLHFNDIHIFHKCVYRFGCRALNSINIFFGTSERFIAEQIKCRNLPLDYRTPSWLIH